MNDNISQERGWGQGGDGWVGRSGITENEMVSLSCLGEDAFPLDISLRVQWSQDGVMHKRVGTGRKEERHKHTHTARGEGGVKILLRTPTHQTPEIGFILNQNKSLPHKSLQLRLNMFRNCDEIYCGRWEKKRIISGAALASRRAEYS